MFHREYPEIGAFSRIRGEWSSNGDEPQPSGFLGKSGPTFVVYDYSSTSFGSRSSLRFSCCERNTQYQQWASPLERRSGHTDILTVFRSFYRTACLLNCDADDLDYFVQEFLVVDIHSR